MNQTKLIKTIEAVDPGRFDCTLREINAISDAAGGATFTMGAYCFKYGFLKGQRAARAASSTPEEIKAMLQTLSTEELSEYITFLHKIQEDNRL